VEKTIEQSDNVLASEVNFYVVSLDKFLILFLATFGLYTVYWFYKHWSEYKKSTKEDMWPIMRSIFSIFFTHSLFSHFEFKYKNKTGEFPKSINYLATIFVATTIVCQILSNLSENGYGAPFTFYLSLLVLPIGCWVLYKAQSLANFSGDDVHGSANSELTFANYAWLVLGFVFWVLMIFGAYSMSNTL
jgi:hypothetical protein